MAPAAVCCSPGQLEREELAEDEKNQIVVCVFLGGIDVGQAFFWRLHQFGYTGSKTAKTIANTTTSTRATIANLFLAVPFCPMGNGKDHGIRLIRICFPSFTWPFETLQVF